MQAHSLKYFAAVARSGSLRHASETFDIAASAISRQIGRLEAELGVTLFDRSTRGMSLTEAGSLLLEHVELNERQIDSLRQKLEDLTELRTGRVRLAVVEATTSDYLPSILAAFTAQHPGIVFEVSVCGTRDVADRLLSNSAEIALAFGSPSRDDLLLRARLPQPLQLIAAPGHPLLGAGPVSMKQLDGVSVALPDRSFGIRRLVERAERLAGIRLRVSLETDSLQLIKNVVASSNLVSLMPPMAYAGELATHRLAAVEVKGPFFSKATIDVITARGHDLSHAARRFLAFLVRAVRA